MLAARHFHRIVVQATLSHLGVKAYLSGMFRAVSRVTDALQALVFEAGAIRLSLDTWPHAPAQEPPDLSAITDRLDKIELGYAKWEAQAEANLLKADALFKHARNSEERTRASVKKANEALESGPEGEAEIREAYAALYGVPPLDAEGGENGGVQPLHPDVDVDAGTPRQRRLMAKFR